MTDRMKALLKDIRREIEDTKDWQELHGVSDALDALSFEADDHMFKLSPPGGE